jgi:peptide/nickel transport system permease protein
MSRVAEPTTVPTGAPTTGPIDEDVDLTINPGTMLVGSFPIRRQRLLVPVVLYLVTVFILITLNFLLPRLMPGDPIDALFAAGSPSYVDRPEIRAELAKYYGLDKSLPGQYVHYLARLAHGDLGSSSYTNTPVRTDLGGKLGWTFLLVTSGAIVSVLIAIPLGVHSGWKRGKRLDKGLLGFFVSYQNLPIFLTASALFVLLAVKLGVVPLSGASTPFMEYNFFGRIGDILHHLALPALILAVDFATLQYLVMRSSMVSELGSDYLLLGRAKGLRERRLKYGYAGRNALLPVITVLGLNVGIAMTSIIFVEAIFGYPGVGQYMVGAIGVRDYPALQGSFLVLALTVVTVNFVVDLAYRRLDPRTAT